MVLIYLLRRVLTVPERVALIARDPDSILTQVSPVISHYSFKSAAYEHRLTRLIMQMLNQGSLPPVAHLIFPTFVSGGTVKMVAD